MSTLARGPVSAGLYIDDAPKLAVTERFVQRVLTVGYDHALIMLDGPGDQLHDVRWTEAELRTFCELTSQHQHAGRPFRRVLTVWAEPTAAFIQQALEVLPPLVKASGASALEFDCEGGWDEARVRGFKSIHDAGHALVDACRQAMPGLELELVTWRARWRHVQALLPHVSRVTVMIYPRRHRDGKKINADDPKLGPLHMVQLELELVGAKLERIAPPLRPTLSAALPCWDQEWPDLAPADALAEERGQAIDRGVTILRDWSSKWVVGARRNTYAAPALTGLYRTA